MKKIKRVSGFTLIELLAVISILLVLSSIGFMAIKKAKEKANRAKCISHLKDLGLAMSLFAEDHQGNFPWGENAIQAYSQIYDKRDFAQTEVFKCPSSKGLPPLPNENKDGLDSSGDGNRVIDYYIVGSLKNQQSPVIPPSVNDPGVNVLLIGDFGKGEDKTNWDHGDNHGKGGSCLFMNQSAQFLTHEQGIPRNYFTAEDQEFSLKDQAVLLTSKGLKAGSELTGNETEI